MKVLAFAASLRKDSYNKKLVRVAVETAKDIGADADYIDLSGYSLPPYDADLESSGQLPSNLEPLRIQIATHEALIISSPEYNHSIPGHFKNTFDWISRIRPMPWQGKSVFLMSASPSLVGGNRGLWALRVPFETCGAFVYPDMFSLSSADKAFHENGTLVDAKLNERLKTSLRKFLEYTHKAFAQ